MSVITRNINPLHAIFVDRNLEVVTYTCPDGRVVSLAAPTLKVCKERFIGPRAEIRYKSIYKGKTSYSYYSLRSNNWVGNSRKWVDEIAEQYGPDFPLDDFLAFKPDPRNKSRLDIHDHFMSLLEYTSSLQNGIYLKRGEYDSITSTPGRESDKYYFSNTDLTAVLYTQGHGRNTESRSYFLGRDLTSSYIVLAAQGATPLYFYNCNLKSANLVNPSCEPGFTIAVYDCNMQGIKIKNVIIRIENYDNIGTSFRGGKIADCSIVLSGRAALARDRKYVDMTECNLSNTRVSGFSNQGVIVALDGTRVENVILARGWESATLGVPHGSFTST